MGYTTAAALHGLGADGQVVVAELAPAVVRWNRGPLADLAGRPLENDRVTVRQLDVAEILRAEKGTYDAILLDVDNGPEGLTRKGNDWLYSRAGLAAAFTTLRAAGVLAVWSASPDRAFAERLGEAGFEVDEFQVRARGAHQGSTAHDMARDAILMIVLLWAKSLSRINSAFFGACPAPLADKRLWKEQAMPTQHQSLTTKDRPLGRVNCPRADRVLCPRACT